MSAAEPTGLVHYHTYLRQGHAFALGVVEACFCASRSVLSTQPIGRGGNGAGRRRRITRVVFARRILRQWEHDHGYEDQVANAEYAHERKRACVLDWQQLR